MAFFLMTLKKRFLILTTWPGNMTLRNRLTLISLYSGPMEMIFQKRAGI